MKLLQEKNPFLVARNYNKQYRITPSASAETINTSSERMVLNTKEASLC